MIDYNKLEHNKKGQVTLRSLMNFLLYCSSDERWDTFWEITHDEENNYGMDWKTFYKGLTFAYQCGKAPHSEAKELFDEISYPPDFISKKDMKWLDKHLQDNHCKVTVYRGCTTGEINKDDIGTSWTTDLGTAEFFAYRFKEKAIETGLQPCVIKAEVWWDSIKAVLLDRNEAEVVITDLCADDVEIIGTEPTEAYEKYMKNK